MNSYYNSYHTTMRARGWKPVVHPHVTLWNHPDHGTVTYEKAAEHMTGAIDGDKYSRRYYG